MLRKLLVATAAFCTLVFAGPVKAGSEILVQQWNAANTAVLSRTIANPTLANCLVYFDALSLLPTCAQVSGGLSLGSGVLNGSGAGTMATWTTLGGKPAWTGVFDGSWATIASTPTTLTGYGITDAYPLSGNPAGYLTGVTSGQVTGALGFTPYNASNPAAYVTLGQSRAGVSLTTTGVGAATYNATTGALNIPTPAAAAAFNFSQPAARSLSVSTSYQAADPSKAAIIVPSYTCTNATTVLAASACTVQVRLGTSSLTCSTGTIYYTQSLSVNLGLLITQNTTQPVQINLPIGAHFIICPTAGTFTISTTEQSVGLGV